MFLPQMFVPQNGRSWHSVGSFLFQGAHALALTPHDFHYSIENKCGKLGRYISFNEIHVLDSIATFNASWLLSACAKLLEKVPNLICVFKVV